jgi:hypothetical protein
MIVKSPPSVVLVHDLQEAMNLAKINGFSFAFFSPEIKNNFEIVLEAVKQNGNSLQFASLEFKNNKNLVLTAVKQDQNSLRFANQNLKEDKEIFWVSKKYFKMIKDVNTFNLYFLFI